jgi:hypothetical protein
MSSAGFALLSGCSLLSRHEELSDLLVSNRSDREVTVEIFVIHLQSGDDVFETQVILEPSSQTEFENPLTRSGNHRIEVSSGDLEAEHEWLVRANPGDPNAEMLIVTITESEIRFQAVE